MLAIKNAFRFIKWQWNRFEVIPKLACASMFSTLMSIVTVKFDAVSDAFLITSIVLALAMFVVLFRTIIKDQYSKFKEERQGLFDTIKHSESGDGGTKII